MTFGLLNEATVLTGDGNWTAGYEVDALSCGRVLQGTDICTPINVPPTISESGTGFKVEPFGIEGHQKFRIVCAPDDADRALTDALVSGSEYFVAKQFWRGDIPNWPGAAEGMFLMDAAVTTVAAAANPSASLAKALQKAYDDNPDIEPIIHMGLNVAFALPATKADELDLPWVVSPGYPPDGIAITGPIVVRLGSTETLKSYDQTTNRQFIQGTRIAAVEFDPCLAVRVV